MQQRRYLRYEAAATFACMVLATAGFMGCGGADDSNKSGHAGADAGGAGGGATGGSVSESGGSSGSDAVGGEDAGAGTALVTGGAANGGGNDSAGGSSQGGEGGSRAGDVSQAGETAQGGSHEAGSNSEGGTRAEAGGAPAAGQGPAQQAAVESVLDDLGFDTEVDPLTDPDGNELTDADQPLGAAVTNLAKADEAFVVSKAGFFGLYDWGYDEEASAFAFTDVTDTVTDSSTEPLSSAEGLFKYAVAADTDGNGKQELVVVVLSPEAQKLLFYRVSENAEGSAMPIAQVASIDWVVPEAPAHVRNGMLGIDLAAGDLDGDGRDEIAMAEMSGCDHDGEDCFTELAEQPALSLFDDDFSRIEEVSLPLERMATGYDTLRVEAGDLNHDSKAELVVAHGNTDLNTVATLSVYETTVSTASGAAKVAALTPLIQDRSLLSTAAAPVAIRTADVKLGDVDGDHQSELVFAGLSSTQVGQIETLVMRYTLNDGVVTDARMLPTRGECALISEQATWIYGLTDGVWQRFRDGDNMAPILALADLDGNGTKEIVSGDDVWALTVSEDGTETLDYAFKGGADSSPTSKGILREGLAKWDTQAIRDAWWNPFPRDTAYFNNVQAGDLNGDGRDEVVVMDFEPSLDTVRLRHFGWNSTTGQLERSPTTDTSMPTTIGYDDGAVLCIADVDRDSTVVEYIGHSLTFSEPIVMAALASAPYYSNLDQNVDSCSTVYGKTTEVSAGVSASVGFSLGRSLGATAEIPLLANGEITATTTTTYSWEFGASVGTSCSTEVDYENPGGQNGVIFTAVPIDVYFYRVISADSTRDDQPKVGDILNVQSMRPVRRTKFTSAEYYNSHNGDYADIDERVFGFEIGDPHSYPTRAEAEAQIASDLDAEQALLLASAEGTLPIGDGVNSVSLATNVAVGGSFSFEAEYSRELEVSFIASAGESQSASVGLSLELEYDTGTLISGSVGGVSEEDYTADADYTWGIYSYPQSLDGMRFTVVSFWVD